MASTTYISILRGINVSGQKKILMSDLKALYESLKFQQVVTYIQSGNVIFNTAPSSDVTQLAQRIEKAIAKQYEFEVPVIVRKAEEIQNVIATNPFLKRKGIALEKLHVTFLADEPSPESLKSLSILQYPPDEYVIKGKEIYLYCPESYGETKLSNKFFESKLKIKATTRNWKTILKLVELSIVK